MLILTIAIKQRGNYDIDTFTNDFPSSFTPRLKMPRKSCQTEDPCILEKYHNCGHMQRCHHHVANRGRCKPMDESWNMLPVCQVGHNLFHSKPLSELAVKYPLVQIWLKEMGWEFNGHKWYHPKDTRFKL